LASITIDNLDPNTGYPRVAERGEAVISWAVTKAHLRDHLSRAEELFDAHGKSLFPVTMQMLLEGNYYSDVAPSGRMPAAVLDFVARHRVSSTDTLKLLMIAAGDLAVEWGFASEATPMQCSMACTIVLAEPSARFFRSFHLDDRVRSQGEISRDIFANTARPPLDAFAPLHVLT